MNRSIAIAITSAIPAVLVLFLGSCLSDRSARGGRVRAFVCRRRCVSVTGSVERAGARSTVPGPRVESHPTPPHLIPPHRKRCSIAPAESADHDMQIWRRRHRRRRRRHLHLHLQTRSRWPCFDTYPPPYNSDLNNLIYLQESPRASKKHIES